ncbi:TIGR02186 family protein [Acuticoccus sp. M5D2P5]|uniref:TIGR02186 family protein n=1 Tax=Acuticoccus kalidii TaxID=2910977 RepID=UPI001F3C8F1A|nr:TIGR02186 family protein [Acuticoccus kalidii]MCF3936431.1 TIGR02186 family protein [Acuticoccus kalidii]
MIRLLAPLAAILALALPAKAERVVADLSTGIIAISSNFAGASVSLFGVIERDAQTVSRASRYQVVVVVTGPPQDVLVQKTERRFGIWMNGAGERFPAMPSYYAILASEDSRHLVEEEDGPARGLSLAKLGADDGTREELRAALASQRARLGLYVEELDAVRMLTPNFFRTSIPLPSVVSDGTYTVTIRLFADGVVLDTEELSFFIAKTGYEQSLFDLSRHQPLIYGLVAVTLALVTGYVGGVVFRRN